MLLPPTDVDVALVAPVYRNADTLDALASRVRTAMDHAAVSFRLVLVVDASPDESWAVVGRLAARDGRISGLLLADNAGQHAAILAGLEAVRARRFVVMDADLQDPPEVIPAMLARARETGSTVFAERKGRYERWDRLATSRTFKVLLSPLSGVPPDVGTFFVVDREVAAAMRDSRARPAQVVILAHHYSERCETIPVRRARRPIGTSAYSSIARVHAAIRSVRCALSCRWQWIASKPHGPAASARIAERIDT
jgi:glycosyltransferase involved in cell wall biosynthesis